MTSVPVAQIRVCDVCEASLVRGEGMCELCKRKEAFYESQFQARRAKAIAEMPAGSFDFREEMAASVDVSGAAVYAAIVMCGVVGAGLSYVLIHGLLALGFAVARVLHV